MSLLTMSIIVILVDTVVLMNVKKLNHELVPILILVVNALLFMYLARFYQ